jgi:putative endonuclease
MFYTYILFSNTANKFYIGSTSLPVEQRLKKHLADHSGFTGKFKDWKIVFTQGFNVKTDALALEKKIKSMKSRKFIEKLIDGSAHPD